MDAGSQSPPPPTPPRSARPGFRDDDPGRVFAEDGLGVSAAAIGEPVQIKRNRKPSGDDLRKSLAWNPAFFTEEGVLDSAELSLLSGSASKSSGGDLGGVSTGISLSPLIDYSKSSSRWGERLAMTKDAKIGESHSRRESLSHEPHVVATKTSVGRSIPRSLPPIPATHSQKRPAGIAASHPVTKIPKFTPVKSRGSSIPINPRATSSKKSFESDDSNSNVEPSSGSRGSITPLPAKSFAHEHGKHTTLPSDKDTTSMKVVTDPSLLAKPYKASTCASLGRVAPLPYSTNRTCAAPSSIAYAKPSALRLPSPSMGFFSQTKLSPSYNSQSQRHSQPFDSSTMKQSTNAKSAGELGPSLLPTVLQSTKGTAPTNSSATGIITGSAKNIRAESVMEMKQLSTRERRHSVAYAVDRHPINGQEQLNTSVGDKFMKMKQLGTRKRRHTVAYAVGHHPINGQEQLNTLVGDKFNSQLSKVLQEKPDCNRAKKAPFENNSFSPKCDTTLEEEAGYIKQLSDPKVPENIHIAGPSNMDSKDGKGSHANFLSQQRNDPKQLEDDNVEGDNLVKHPQVENTECGVCTVLSECGLAAESSVCMPDLGSGHVTEDASSSASPEAKPSCRLSNNQIAGDASTINFSSQQGSACQQKQESNFGGNDVAKNRLLARRNGVYAALSESELAAQNPPCLPDSGFGLGKQIYSGASTEFGPSIRCNSEGVSGEVSCIRFSSKQSPQRDQQEDNFGGENLAKNPNVGNTLDKSCTVLSNDKLDFQNSYLPPVRETENIDTAASVKAKSPFKLRKQDIAGAGTRNSIGRDSALTQDSFSEAFESTPSEDKVLEVYIPHGGLSNEISTINAGTELKSDIVKTKCKVNAPPFSDEWLAALETIGEEILQLKSGPVQNSPPDKSVPEPGPWSPVKRKAEEIGPFDCTKYSKNLSASNTP